MAQSNLTSEERTLCKLIAHAGTTNHFSNERLELDRRIGNSGPGASKKTIFSNLMGRIKHLVAELKSSGRGDVRNYGDEDRDIVGFTFLFHLFHYYMPHFDEHILKQIDSANAPLPVAFARDALRNFAVYGFGKDVALEFFSIFFQLRRAYFFIEERLVGESDCMRQLRIDLWNNIFTCDQIFYRHHLLGKMEDFSTLILGETGTGKGTAAAAIGRSGFIPFNPSTDTFAQSFTNAFVSLNLSQFPEGILESELFGHKKGAFTGAVESHEGVFDRCSSHGSIFLDEIGDVSIPVQIKLLQVLQDRTFTPVGSHDRRRFSGRVIGATNKDIDELRRSGTFRNDFFYRLCSDIITVPSLAERIRQDRNELSLLVGHLTAQITGSDDAEVIATIQQTIDEQVGGAYHWPGNVRELEQCIRRILLKRSYRGDKLSEGVDEISQIAQGIRAETLCADELLAQYCRSLYKRHKNYEAVARIAGLDRRTVKKHIDWARHA
ncbi:MAG: sigma-54-dependent Fis family transcriptional regulator [Chitinivibrionales bacterium]|nr:sigma-54-dependent Fis family transcriptional regulator [Chitinivibrionales bacterium]